MRRQTAILALLSLFFGLETEITAFARPPLSEACGKLANPKIEAIVSSLLTDSGALKKLELALTDSLKDDCGGVKPVSVLEVGNCVRSLANEMQAFDEAFGTRDAQTQMLSGIQYQANLKSLCGKISPACFTDLKRETRDFKIKDFPDVVKECIAASGKLTDVNAQGCSTAMSFAVVFGTGATCKIACCSP